MINRVTLNFHQLDSRVLSSFPAKRDVRFEYDRPETSEVAAARHINFFEFSYSKRIWPHISSFEPDPWKLQIGGLCRNEMEFDLPSLLKQFAKSHTERLYRHRCIETWAMAIPWSGIPLAEIVKAADPLDSATHIRLVSFDHQQTQGRAEFSHPWPYHESLTLPEATNQLTFLATGMYGHPLLKQHGAPIRLVVPWKYGVKSIKSIVKIEFVDYQPKTFWSTVDPTEYDTVLNVDPEVPHPRWSQKMEWMLGTKQEYPTQRYNGYEDYVAHLYA